MLALGGAAMLASTILAPTMLASTMAAQAQAQAPTAASPTAVQTAPFAGAAAETATSAPATGVSSAAPAGGTGAGSGAAAPAATPAKPATPQFYKPTPGIGQPTDRIGLQPQETANGQYAAWFHDGVLLPIITGICVVVLFLLLYVMARHNRRSNPQPSATSHNTVLEVAWTVLPVLILLGIAVPSIKLIARQYDTPKPDLTVKVIGHQWYWSYQYPDNGDFEVVSNMLTPEQDRARGEPRQLGVDERMVVPAGAVVKVIATSDDVIHSFAVPAFWTKIDAVPGRLNETWFKVDRPGVYYGQCSELCGARHAFMPIAVEVVTRPQFAQWIAAKGGTLGGKAASPDATSNSPISNPSATTANPGSFGGAVAGAKTEAAAGANIPVAGAATSSK
ncbi:cytochrome c oxidase subunit II [Sphingomonas morindae]